MKIVDIQPFKYQLIESESGHGKTKVRGVFQRADEKNANGRVYPRKLWEKILSSNDLKETIERRRMVGEVDHPMESEVKLSKAAVVITGLQMNENNEVVGELEILPTDYGKHVSALFNSGVEVGISSRGEGSTYEKEGVEYISEDDYRLLAFDIVASPSTRGAYPTLLKESKKDPDNSNDKIEETQMSANQNFNSLRENIRSVVGTDLSKTTKDQRSRLVTEAERLVGELSKVTSEDQSFRILGESLASDLLHFVKQAESSEVSPVLENQIDAAAEIIEAMASEVKAREGKVLRLASKRIAESSRKSSATIAELRKKNARLVRENSRLRKTLETAEVVGEEITNQFIALSKDRKKIKEASQASKPKKKVIVESKKKTSSKILEKLSPKKVRIKEDAAKPASKYRADEVDQSNIFESFQAASQGSFRL